jgi:hypothetical protein
VRNISFALTTPQVQAEEKDVTRRMGWETLQVGQLLQGCEKCQGLGKGGKLVKIAVIRVVSVRRERLDRLLEDIEYGWDEMRREGFPDWSPQQFVSFFCKTHQGASPSSLVTRIEFEYANPKKSKAALPKAPQEPASHHCGQGTSHDTTPAPAQAGRAPGSKASAGRRDDP